MYTYNLEGYEVEHPVKYILMYLLDLVSENKYNINIVNLKM